MDPATIRYSNPGGQYPGPSARKFGSTGTEIIGGGHKIAVFPDAVSGAAAQFDLLAERYAGLPLGQLITKWSGGNSASQYIANVARATGISPDTVVTREMLADPKFAVPFAKVMAKHETGRDYPMSDDQWAEAHARAIGNTAQPVGGPVFSPTPEAQAPPEQPPPMILGGLAGMSPPQTPPQAPPETPPAQAPISNPMAGDEMSAQPLMRPVGPRPGGIDLQRLRQALVSRLGTAAGRT